MLLRRVKKVIINKRVTETLKQTISFAKTFKMILKSFLTLTAAFCIHSALSAQCPDWESADKSKQIKVTVWSENDECFRILLNGKELHPDSARQVIFWVSGTDMAMDKMTLQIRGQEDKKNLFVNKDMTEVYYRVDRNKKGEYSLRGEPSKAQISPEAQARRDAEQKAAEEKRAAAKAQADKEWEEKLAAQKAEREKEKAAEAQKDAAEKAQKEEELAKKREEENKARGYGGTTTTPAAGTTTTPASGTATTPATAVTTALLPYGKYTGKGSSKVTTGKYSYKEQYFYNGKPLANTLITYTTRDSIILAVAMTDAEGRATLKTDFPPGQYRTNIFGEKPNTSWGLCGIYISTFSEDPKDFEITDFKNGVEQVSKMMGMDPALFAASMGF
jgi:hypothetical protein